ncbi:unnamed protein product [Amoebophrya sp. A25]|nr:unnamed protein product [Amoebophrya sp. A25]|eukprot:GSA25T00016749001.1
MGQRLSQDCALCWDPEEASRQIRSKKQQKAALQKYEDLLAAVEYGADARTIEEEIAKHDAYCNGKGADWRREMESRPQFAEVQAKRAKLRI